MCFVYVFYELLCVCNNNKKHQQTTAHIFFVSVVVAWDVVQGPGTTTTGRWARSLDVGELAVIRAQMGGDKEKLELPGAVLIPSAIFTVQVTFRLTN